MCGKWVVGASRWDSSVRGVGCLSANLMLCGNNCTVNLGGGGGPIILFSTKSRDT